MNSESLQSIDLAPLRRRLAEAHGPIYWRCLEELADEQGFLELMRDDYPRQFAALGGQVNRRKFLGLLSASLALAGLQGCDIKPPMEKIVPYVKTPPNQKPGGPLFFATAATLGGYATGLLVESHEGRPTKVEGNPQHPASLGGVDIFSQASVLDLYDPDRSQVVVSQGQTRTWEDLATILREAIERTRPRQGEGFRLLTEAVTSPTLAFQITELLRQFPSAKWICYEPASREFAMEGARLAFGQSLDTIYHFDRAKTILSLDADFLGAGPERLLNIRQFALGRRVRGTHAAEPQAIAPHAMNRLYVVESTPSITGAKADHRWPLRPFEVELFARAVAARLEPRIAAPEDGVGTIPPAWLDAVGADLREHGRESLVVAGDQQPPAVHLLAHLMNQALGNVGHTVDYIDPVEAQYKGNASSLQELVHELDQGGVDTLLILGGNPVFTAPVDFEFAKRLKRCPLRIHLSQYEDETSELCHWQAPESHYLESWGDARAFDGTATIIQPLIAPLYGGKTAQELLSVILDPTERPGYEITRKYWFDVWKEEIGKAAVRASDDDKRTIREANEAQWRKSLHDGIVAGTAFRRQSPAIETSAIDRLGAVLARDKVAPTDLEILFRPDATIYDGRFANNGWLQELPKPLTKLTWDNAALISPATAERFGLHTRPAGHGGEHGEALADMVELEYRGRTLSIPVWILPGQTDGVITISLGYGRTKVGRVGQETGVNAYLLRDSHAPWFDSGLKLTPLKRQFPLACTQYHHQMENRRLLRSGTLERFQATPQFAADASEELPTLYEPREFSNEGYKWGMAIDLSACVGCNACVTACQAENNIPVVGKEQVTRGREMHWLRIDRYYVGNLDSPRMEFLPVPCMHCENAPCELVCPVGATVHTSEGLNDMIYNRCVGTRYCSNNCPYKVRRFNFLQYADYTTESLKMLRNPEVTVRTRGVMEKCTYCVQRITQAKIHAEKEDRSVRDGEILTACQASCPAQAISFGDLNDSKSEVSQWKQGPLNYALLEELNTRPRTTYLASLSNPNPRIDDASHAR